MCHTYGTSHMLSSHTRLVAPILDSTAPRQEVTVIPPFPSDRLGHLHGDENPAFHLVGEGHAHISFPHYIFLPTEIMSSQ